MKPTAASPWQSAAAQRFSQALVAINDVDVMQAFLRDVLTEAEIAEISARFQAAGLLQAGASYTQVIAETRLSSRTVARISRWLQSGRGGYRAALALTSHHRLASAGESLR